MLTFVFLLLSAAFAVWSASALGYIGIAWLGMFLLLGMAAFAAFLLLFVLFLFICTRFVDQTKPQTRPDPFFRFLLIETTGLILFLCGTWVKTQGLEKIPADRPFLLVGNHRSNLDPIAAIWALRRHSISFISKPENLRLPIVGKAIHKCAFLAIDRDDDRRAVATILAAAEQIQSRACSVCIYPEGTRNRQNTKLLPFKNGSFKIAQRTGAPIVVAAIDGSERVCRRFPLPTRIKLTIAGVIEQPEGQRTNTQALSQEARALLCRALDIEDAE